LDTQKLGVLFPEIFYILP